MSLSRDAIVAHTPGPWTFVGSAIEADSPTRPGFTDVIGWVSTDVDEVNADANGRLIAAAPELLAELHAAARLLQDSRHPSTEQWARIWEVIAKAGGKP